MTISSTTSKNQYVASGSNPTFTYTFKIYDEADIRVLSDDTVNTLSDYVVTGVGNSAGGTIVFNVNPVASTIVTLKRNEPLTQEIEYVEGDDFPAESHEQGLDRSAIRDQFLQEQIDRALLLPESTTASSFGLADPTGNALKLLQLNATEDEIDYVEIVGSLTGVAISPGDAGKPVVVNATEDGFEVGVTVTGITQLTGDVTTAMGSGSQAATIANGAVTEAKMTLADNTTNNASTTKHGFLKKLSNVATEFMNGVGDWVSVTEKVKASVLYDATTAADVTGTYSQSAFTVTVSVTGHNQQVGHLIQSTIGTGTAVTGTYTVVSVIDANTFTYTAGTSLVTSGNITLSRRLIRGSNGVANVAYIGTGQHAVNFSTAMSSINYRATFGGYFSVSTFFYAGGRDAASTPTTMYCRVGYYQFGGNVVNSAYSDMAFIE